MTEKPRNDLTDDDDIFETEDSPDALSGRDIGPDSIRGGSSGSTAYRRSSPEDRPGDRPPEEDVGDASIERRERDLEYRGPERRLAKL
jgi:hypothetical protein